MKYLTRESLTVLFSDPDVEVASIADIYGVPVAKVYRLASEWNIERGRKAEEDESPSEEEIARLTAEIRMGWSQEEHERRAVGFVRRAYRIPIIETSDLVGSCDLPSHARI